MRNEIPRKGPCDTRAAFDAPLAERHDGREIRAADPTTQPGLVSKRLTALCGLALFAGVLCGLSLSVIGCALPAGHEHTVEATRWTFDEAAQQRTRAEVRTVFDQFVAAENEGALLPNVVYFSDSPQFRWYEDGMLQYSSRADVRAARESVSQYGSLETIYSDIEVIAWSPDAALVSAAYATTIGDLEQGGFSFGGRMTLDMVRVSPPREGEPSWQFLVGHTSSRRPPPAGAAGQESQP